MEPGLLALVHTELKALSVKYFTVASKGCPELTALRDLIQKGQPKTAKSLSLAPKPYFAITNELSVQNTIEYRGPQRRIVPVSLRKQLISLAHKTHHGIVRTKQRLQKLQWWPSMDLYVEESIRKRVTCQVMNKSHNIHAAALQPIPLPACPQQKVGIDIVGPFESASWACRDAVTLIDYYTKWPEVAFTFSITTTAITAFQSTVFSRFRNPTKLVNDNGT